MRTCLINPLTGRSVKTDSAIGRKLVGGKFANLLKTTNKLSKLVTEQDTKKPAPKKKVGRPKKAKTDAEVLAKPKPIAPKKKVGRPKKVKSNADVVIRPPPRHRSPMIVL